jgi:saccharopine dehydrogenase-like NADP-dependent oxidoreductase
VTDGTFLVLGGAGMVGFEVAHQVANSLRPRRVVLASLPADAVAAAVERLRRTISQLLIGDILAEQDEPVVGD